MARAATKIVKATDIMKMKGIAQREMDMDKFNKVIENFFLTHEAKETILLTPKRFIEMDNPPEDDFIDCLDVTIWEKKCDDPNDPFDFISYQYMKKGGMLRPMLIVNEPFIGNAAGILRSLCGFVVKSRTRKKKKEYIVSLPV